MKKQIEPQLPPISTQVSTSFSTSIMGKYSWTFTTDKRVALQHKVEGEAKSEEAISITIKPQITLHQTIQPLHLNIVMKQLIFSQLALYKQNLLVTPEETRARQLQLTINNAIIQQKAIDSNKRKNHNSSLDESERSQDIRMQTNNLASPKQASLAKVEQDITHKAIQIIHSTTELKSAMLIEEQIKSLEYMTIKHQQLNQTERILDQVSHFFTDDKLVAQLKQQTQQQLEILTSVKRIKEHQHDVEVGNMMYTQHINHIEHRQVSEATVLQNLLHIKKKNIVQTIKLTTEQQNQVVHQQSHDMLPVEQHILKQPASPQAIIVQSDVEHPQSAPPVVQKRGRGRPRKQAPIDEQRTLLNEETLSQKEISSQATLIHELNVSPNSKQSLEQIDIQQAAEKIVGKIMVQQTNELQMKNSQTNGTQSSDKQVNQVVNRKDAQSAEPTSHNLLEVKHINQTTKATTMIYSSTWIEKIKQRFGQIGQIGQSQKLVLKFNRPLEPSRQNSLANTLQTNDTSKLTYNVAKIKGKQAGKEVTTKLTITEPITKQLNHENRQPARIVLRNEQVSSRNSLTESVIINQHRIVRSNDQVVNVKVGQRTLAQPQSPITTINRLQEQSNVTLQHEQTSTIQQQRSLVEQAQPIVKRHIISTLDEQVRLHIKEQQVQSKTDESAQVKQLHTQLKTLEKNLEQQAEVLKQSQQRINIKQLSTQVYDELSRRIKFDRQRLGR